MTSRQNDDVIWQYLRSNLAMDTIPEAQEPLFLNSTGPTVLFVTLFHVRPRPYSTLHLVNRLYVVPQCYRACS